jgi:hypothetical protein
VDKALQRALDAYLFESGFVVKGLVSGMELTDPVYTSNFANGPFLVWDWPCWLAWRISRVLLVGVGFGLFSHEAWEEVARTGKEIKMLVQQLFSASEK